MGESGRRQIEGREVDAHTVRQFPAHRPRYDWWVVLGLVGTLIFCGAFWAGVGYGISLLVGVADAKPKPDPPPAAVTADPAGYSCTYSGIKVFTHGATSSAVCVKVK